MRTNIVLDDALVNEAFRRAPVKPRRELVDLALRQFVARESVAISPELVGKVKLDPACDYKKARIGRGGPCRCVGVDERIAQVAPDLKSV